MKTIEQAGELKGKTVFMRADFDVPVIDGNIAEPFRIQRQKAMLQHLLNRGARVVLAAHISAVPSFEPLKPQLEQLLGVSFGDTVALLENTRQDPGEEANDEAFAKKLIAGCDVYVNNAFAVCHREHASVVAAAKLLPAYAGLLVQEEIEHLSAAVNAPPQGKVVFIGGAKVSTKLPIVARFLDKAEAIVVGGKVANEMESLPDPRVHMPVDFAEEHLDIGPNTAQQYAELATNARFIIWNGPMGKFEDKRYMNGTRVLAEAIAASSAEKVIGGGDTIAAVDKLGLLDTMGFVSTGGGAMLAFLAGQRLPGLEILE